jgi:hypothetical protein
VAKETFNKLSFFSSDSMPYGKTYGYWTVKWWRWFLLTPKSMNPIVDRTGKYAYVNQPSKNVWFLAGKVIDDDRKLPNRSCRISRDRSILFPVINYEANPIEYPELASDEEIVGRVKREEDTIVKKNCTVNGVAIPTQRVKSDPLIFELMINKDNAVNIQEGGRTRASADGYWVFLKPLPPGDYTVIFEGSCKDGKLYSGAEYNLQVL